MIKSDHRDDSLEVTLILLSMKHLYNFGIRCYTAAIAIAALTNPKAKLWHNGRKGLIEHIEQRLATRSKKQRVWIHAASLGEFEQARPIIEKIDELGIGTEIIVTFFSPSGYEIRKTYPLAKEIFYLPADTPSNAKRFIDAINPSIAIFIKYDFWLNYLTELRHRQIPTYLVSAIFREESIFFKPWGEIWRNALSTFRTMFVQNDTSKILLNRLGYDNCIVAGDTRFDRVSAIANSGNRVPIIESFRGNKATFVAGSTWRKDEDILVDLANDNPDVKFVIAPHEIENNNIENIRKRCRGGAICYTECCDSTNYDNYQVLILNTIGLLSTAYKYATWAYVGGGFGAGIHNTLEPAIYGLPIAFGPRYEKFNEAVEMIARGGARCINNYNELSEWFAPLRNNSNEWQRAHTATREYTDKNRGATELIVKEIFGECR
jgi:3-deoxy-D-manno-octulosonic-acid transferase